MTGSPKWKVYDADGNYEAACKSGEVAASVVALLGDGAVIKADHRLIVWREGKEEISAAESYDTVARVIAERLIDVARKQVNKNMGAGTWERWEEERKARDA
jgi:diaminopimelate epimerase